MYRNLYVVLGGCAFLLAVFFVAFNGAADGPADYVWTNGTEPETLDVAYMTGQPEGDVAAAMFEGLTVYHPETLAPTPGVADRWEVDGLRYTFHLRPDSWWIKQGRIWEAGGRKRNVTAHDFVYSWKRQCLPETGAKYSFLLDFIEGVEDFKAETARQWRALCDEWASSGRGAPKDLTELDASTRAEVERRREELWRSRVGVEAADDRTLKVTLKSPIPFFFQLTSFYSLTPCPREAIEAHGNEWTLPRHIVSNGPYWLESWRFNYKIRLRKNPHYWETGDHARSRIEGAAEGAAGDDNGYAELLRRLGPFSERGLETLDALAIEREDTALNLYLNGDNDKVRSLPTHIVADLLEEDRKRRIPDLHHAIHPTIYYYDVNLALPAFQRKEAGRKFRRALALAIDRGRLVKEITRAGQRPAYALVPEGFVPGFQAEARFGSGDFAADVAEARRLLAESKEAGLTPPTLRIVYNNMEAHKAVAAFIQDQWKRHLGVEATLENQEWQVYLNSRRQGNFDVARAAWIPDYSDPNTFLDMFTSDDFESDRDPARLERPIEYNSQNHGKYNNPHYNRIVLRYCMRTPVHLDSPEKRRAIVEDVRSWEGFSTAVAGAVRRSGATTIEELERLIDAYDDPAADKADLARRIRLVLLEIAEQMLLYDLPVLPIYHYTMTELWPPQLEGIAMNERDAHPQKFLRWRGGARPSQTRYRDFPHLWPRLD
jgi:oligopeptide transport system substrate-binding protein